MNGSATATTSSAMTVGGIITLSGTSQLTMGASLTVTGNVSIGTNTTLTTGNYALIFGSDFTNSGTFTAGNLSITLDCTAATYVSRISTTGSVSLTKTSGTATFAGNVSGG